MRKSIVLAFVVLALAAGPVLADIIHVPGEYPTIQEGIDAADNGDIVLVAQWHATIGGSRGRWVPAIEDIPAFRRLGLQSATPELGLKIVEAGDQAIKKIDRLLTP